MATKYTGDSVEASPINAAFSPCDWREERVWKQFSTAERFRGLRS